MKKSKLVVTLFLMLWTTCYASAATRGVVLKKDQTAPYSGYLYDLQTGKAIAEGWSKAEADAATYKKAYDSLKAELAESEDVIRQIIEADRTKYRKKQKEARSKARWNSITWFVIGGALGAVIHNNS